MTESITEWIYLYQMRDGYLYHIDARIASLGIWDTVTKSFEVSRTKFNDNFIDREDHWDLDNQGTAKPIKEIEKCGVSNSSDQSKLKYLNRRYKELSKDGLFDEEE